MLTEQIKKIAERFHLNSSAIVTEEATKTALVLPMLTALGYDVFDPLGVVPEFTADIGSKKGEKVDYALMFGGEPTVLIECKNCNSALDNKHASQLFRYFTATNSVRLTILTNGVEYRFYADLEKSNRMDERPFFTFSILDFDDQHAAELAKFSKDAFDVDAIIDSASNLKYLNLTKTYLRQQLDDPSDEFVRFVTKSIYDGQVRTNIVEVFSGLIKRAADQLIRDRIKEKLRNAFDETADAKEAEPKSLSKNEEDLVTTDEEVFGHQIIRAIAASVCDPDRITMRDAKSYCAILFDDNNRRPVARLHFNSSKKRIGLFTGENEERFDIEREKDIYKFSKQILETIQKYL